MEKTLKGRMWVRVAPVPEDDVSNLAVHVDGSVWRFDRKLSKWVRIEKIPEKTETEKKE